MSIPEENSNQGNSIIFDIRVLKLLRIDKKIFRKIFQSKSVWKYAATIRILRIWNTYMIYRVLKNIDKELKKWKLALKIESGFKPNGLWGVL